ncbi:hypothetical protein [Stenotrophomonas sp. PS02298]|uniref:hypothetical protein n=1 Tax=Stenotrophomonas sp. PS02298 TaxID=2991424 RepID=UPI002499E4B6|nr:hypothetical protein [Stenotrophomonas sp. PS02298]
MAKAQTAETVDYVQRIAERNGHETDRPSVVDVIDRNLQRAVHHRQLGVHPFLHGAVGLDLAMLLHVRRSHAVLGLPSVVVAPLPTDRAHEY